MNGGDINGVIDDVGDDDHQSSADAALAGEAHGEGELAAVVVHAAGVHDGDGADGTARRSAHQLDEPECRRHGHGRRPGLGWGWG